MAVTAEIYAQFFENALRGNLDDLEGEEALECMLLNTDHSFSEADEFVDDIVANEIDDADYSRQALTGVSVSQGVDSDDNQINVDADDINFGNELTISAYYAVIYQSQTDDTDSPLMFHVDFDGEEASQDGTFELQVHDYGLFDVVT